MHALKLPWFINILASPLLIHDYASRPASTPPMCPRRRSCKTKHRAAGRYETYAQLYITETMFKLRLWLLRVCWVIIGRMESVQTTPLPQICSASKGAAEQWRASDRLNCTRVRCAPIGPIGPMQCLKSPFHNYSLHAHCFIVLRIIVKKLSS